MKTTNNNTKEREMTTSELKNEAIRKLQSFQATGCWGFFDQAVARCKEAGINCERVSRTEAGASNLLSHLLMW